MCCRDNFCAYKVNQDDGGCGDNCHHYFHVAVEDLKKHCLQLLPEFWKDNCGCQTGNGGPVLHTGELTRELQKARLGTQKPPQLPSWTFPWVSLTAYFPPVATA